MAARVVAKRLTSLLAPNGSCDTAVLVFALRMSGSDHLGESDVHYTQGRSWRISDCHTSTRWQFICRVLFNFLGEVSMLVLKRSFE